MRRLRWLRSAPTELTAREREWFGVAAVANGAGIGGTIAGLLASSLPCALAGATVWIAGWILLGVLLIRAGVREGRRRLAELEERRQQVRANHEEQLAELAELRRRLGLSDDREERS